MEVVSSNITYTYVCHVVLGTLDEIRAWVYQQPYRPRCEYRFTDDRQHWMYVNTSDAGFPVQGYVRVGVGCGDPQMIGPAAAFPAAAVPRLQIRAAYHIANSQPGQTVGQLFWATDDVGGGYFQETQSVLVPVVADGQFHTYDVDLRAVPTYHGLISQLRFDPIGNGDAGDYVDVAFISAWTTNGVPYGWLMQHG